MRLSPIPEVCDRRQSGIRRLLAVEEGAVLSMTINTSGQVTNVSLAAGYSFRDIPLDSDEARFTQTMSRPGVNPQIRQSINFYRMGLISTVQQSLFALALSCNIIVLAQASSGEWYLFGINAYPEMNYSWEPAGLRATDSLIDSGQPSQGSKGTTTTLSATTNHYAPEFIGDVSALPVDLSQPVYQPDTTGPFLLYYTPADGSIGVPVNPILSLHFNEAVQPGSGTIYLRRYSDDIAVDSWQQSSPDIAISSSGQTVVLTLGLTLQFETRYYFDIPAGAFLDASGNPFTGNSKGDGDFTTVDELSGTPPEIITLDPADDSSSLTSGLVPFVAQMFFDKPVQIGGGTARLYLSDGTLVSTVAIGSASSVLVNGDVLQLSFNTGLLPETAYYILTDAGIVVDLFANPVAAISDSTSWNFTTEDTTPPVLETNNLLGPEEFNFRIAVDAPLRLFWSEAIQVDTGAANTMALQVVSPTPGPLVPVSNGDVSVIGNELRIEPSTPFDEDSVYQLTVYGNYVSDLAGNAQTQTYVLQFATGYTFGLFVDDRYDAELGIAVTNASGALEGQPGDSIRLYELGGSLVKIWAYPFTEVVPVGQTNVFTGKPAGGNTMFRLTNHYVTIGQDYYLEVDAGIFRDRLNDQVNAAVNTTDALAFNPVVNVFGLAYLSFYPASGAEDVGRLLDRLAVHSTRNALNNGTSGSLSIYRFSDDTLVHSVAYNDPAVNNRVTPQQADGLGLFGGAPDSNFFRERCLASSIIDIPAGILEVNTQYYVIIDQGFHRVPNGTTLTTPMVKGDWTFTTGSGDFSNDFNDDFN